METLPLEIKKFITEYLSVKEIDEISSVNKDFYNLTQSIEKSYVEVYGGDYFGLFVHDVDNYLIYGNPLNILKLDRFKNIKCIDYGIFLYLKICPYYKIRKTVARLPDTNKYNDWEIVKQGKYETLHILNYDNYMKFNTITKSQFTALCYDKKITFETAIKYIKKYGINIEQFKNILKHHTMTFIVYIIKNNSINSIWSGNNAPGLFFYAEDLNSEKETISPDMMFDLFEGDVYAIIDD